LASYLHPASLNEFQRYRQANAILGNTSRATSPDWYRQALDLGFQLHIRIDGTSISSFYHDHKNGTWEGGPTLTDEHLRNLPSLESLLPGILKYVRSFGAKSLGVVLHIADEFATAELSQAATSAESLEELRYAIHTSPSSILADSSIPADQASWRIMPYTSGRHGPVGTAICLSRQWDGFLCAFRTIGEEENFPVVTQALSAPLVALQGLGQVLHPTAERPFVAILQYPWFTAMAFFNEHANLVLIRSLQHRGLRRPTNFRHALTTTSASLELMDPDLYLAPLGQSVDQTLCADLKLTFPNQRVEEIRQADHADFPAWATEPLISTSAEESQTLQSNTFDALREQKWATQDFLPPISEAQEIYPVQGEMKMLRAFKLTRLALCALVLLTIIWASLQVIYIFNQPAWWFSPTEAASTKQKVARFTQEKKKIDYWDNMLADRSKAWISMESLVRLFPEGSGLQLKAYSYAAHPESTPGQAMTGFSKEWKITGLAKEEALEYLNTLNTREGIASHFDQIAKITGNEAYQTDLPTRSLIVNIRTSENPSFKTNSEADMQSKGDSSFPFTFDLTITQRFEGTDPMAINAAKAP